MVICCGGGDDEIDDGGGTCTGTDDGYYNESSSVGTKSLHIFRQTFPNVPFVFVYRDPIHVLMSHLDPSSSSRTTTTTTTNTITTRTRTHKKQKHNTHVNSHAVCLRYKHKAPSDLKELVRKHTNKKDITKLSNEQVCAAHLAKLCHKALTHISQSNGLGLLINYNTLPTSLTQRIIPHFLHFEEEDYHHTQEWNWELLEQMGGTYSKGGRGGEGGGGERCGMEG